MLIGITGKSGSGKSTITKIFKEIDTSIQIIDVDKIAHESYLDISTKKKIIALLGSKVLNEDLSINRKKVSDIVFNDKELMEKLCSITKTFIEKRTEELIAKADITILDYALLPMSKQFKKCDLLILVTAPFSNREKRVINRDHVSKAKFNEINNNCLEYNRKEFDFVIENNYDLSDLRKVIGEIYEKSIIPWKF